MRARDLTLSASLIGLYVAIIIIGATTPFKFTALMLSALFGLFWNYFSLKTNLSFQVARLGFNFIKCIRTSPVLAATIKAESNVGLAFFDWINFTSAGVLEKGGVKVLELTGKQDMSILLFIIYLFYSLLHCTIIPYFFYRYFRKIGIYKRLPSF